MMVAPALKIRNLSLIAQEVGTPSVDNGQSVWTPVSGADFPPPSAINDTRKVGMFAGPDLWFGWDDGEGGMLMAGGDNYDYDWVGPASTLRGLSSANRTIHANSNGVDLTTLSGGTLQLDGTATISTTLPGIMAIKLTGTTGEIAYLKFTGRISSVLQNVTWICGTGSGPWFATTGDGWRQTTVLGSVLPGMTLNTDYGWRVNALARVTNTDFSGGRIIGSWPQLSAAKTSKEFLPGAHIFTSAVTHFNTAVTLSSVTAALWVLTVRATAHGLVEGQQVRFFGTGNFVVPDNLEGFVHVIDANTFTLFNFAVPAGASTTVGAGSNGGDITNIGSWGTPSAGQLSVASNTAFLSFGRVEVQTSTGYAVIQYTGKSGSTLLTGCTLVNGSGIVSTGGTVKQAMQQGTMSTAVNNNVTRPVQASNYGMIPTGAVSIPGAGVGGSTRQYVIFNGFKYAGSNTNALNYMALAYSDDLGASWTIPVADTTIGAGSNGGDITNIASWGTPGAGILTIASNVSLRNASVSDPQEIEVDTSNGVAYIRYTGKNVSTQLTGCTLIRGSGIVSTGGGVRQGMWGQNSTYTDRIAGNSSLWRPGDGYVYSLIQSLASSPASNLNDSICGCRIMRAPEASVLSIEAWRYWDGATWGTSKTAAVNVFLGTTNPKFSGWGVYYHAYSGNFIMLCTDNFSIYYRTAPNLVGPWSDAEILLDVNMFPAGTFIYGGFIQPWSNVKDGAVATGPSGTVTTSIDSASGDPTSFDFTVSIFGPYGAYLFRGTLVSKSSFFGFFSKRPAAV